MQTSQLLSKIHSNNFSTSTNQHDENILIAQTQTTFRQVASVSVFILIGMLLLGWIMWGVVPGKLIIIWYLLHVLIIGVVSAIFFMLNKRTPVEKRYSKPWRIAMVGLILTRGFVMGFCTVWFLYTPDSLTHQLILAVTVVGAAAMAAISTTAYQPAFFATTLTLLTPLILRFSFEPDTFHHLLALGTFFFLVSFIFLNRKIYQLMRNSLYLRFELDRQKQMAEDAKRAQTRFLAAASHDLRQPLHAHGLLVSSLKQKVTEKESSRILQVLEKSMYGMQGLLNSLLDISKLDAGALTPDITRFDVQSLLQQLFLDYEKQADHKGLKFALHSKPFIVQSDKTLLERILRNIISNAIRYTDEGAVLIATRYRGDKLRIEVRDSGLGIDPKDHEIIFQEFQQLNNDHAEITGLGLGLAIVRRLASLLHHKVDIKSEAGRGSIFAIEVPRILSSHINTVVEDFNYSGDDLRNINVLVIDDEPAILEGMRNVLKDWYCHAYTASNYKEAFTLLDTHELIPDIAIIDYRLREMNGIELMNRLSNKFKIDVPTIIITGDTAPSRLGEIYASGHYALHKPVPPSKLRALMSHLLRQYSTN